MHVPSGEKEAFTIFISDVPVAENSGDTENGWSWPVQDKIKSQNFTKKYFSF